MTNKNPVCKFKKSPQGLDEAKSRGQVERSKEVNNLKRIRTLWGASSIDGSLIDGIEKEVQNGKYDNAIKLLNIIKEPEAQNINLNGGVEVQKVFIDEKTKQETKKHIKEFIDD